MLIRCRGHVFARDGTQWFVWEPQWDSMRPIDGFGWNGTTYVLLDEAYTVDPFSPHFGFGSAEMEECAVALTDRVISDLDKAREVPHVLIGTPTWFRDHWVVLAPGASGHGHREFLGQRARTARRAPRGQRSTKRVRRQDKPCA